MYLFVCLCLRVFVPVCVSSCLSSLDLSVCVCVLFLFLCLRLFACLCVFVCLFCVSLFVCVSVCVSMYVFLCAFVCLCVCLFLCVCGVVCMIIGVCSLYSLCKLLVHCYKKTRGGNICFESRERFLGVGFFTSLHFNASLQFLYATDQHGEKETNFHATPYLYYPLDYYTLHWQCWIWWAGCDVTVDLPRHLTLAYFDIVRTRHLTLVKDIILY